MTPTKDFDREKIIVIKKNLRKKYPLMKNSHINMNALYICHCQAWERKRKDV